MSKELVIGKRYWLDVNKDVSAVFIGYGDDGKRHLFNNAQGSEKYQVIENGIIPFLKCPSGISEVVDINHELVTSEDKTWAEEYKANEEQFFRAYNHHQELVTRLESLVKATEVVAEDVKRVLASCIKNEPTTVAIEPYKILDDCICDARETISKLKLKS